MRHRKIYRALLLILGISIATPTIIQAADTSNGSGGTTSSANDTKKEDKKEATNPSPEKGSGEKSGSGGSEPECN